MQCLADRCSAIHVGVEDGSGATNTDSSSPVRTSSPTTATRGGSSTGIPTPESSQPGVFVAGDLRHGSIKRVATAVGEGAMAASLIHRDLALEPGHERLSCT